MTDLLKVGKDDELFRFTFRTGIKFIERPRHHCSLRLVTWERRFARWPHKIEGFGWIWLQHYFVCEIERRQGPHRPDYYDIVRCEAVETLQLPREFVWRY